MEWDDVVAAAHSISWVTAFSTSGADGRPAVSFVAPGFAGGRIYVGTRPRTRKARNLAHNPNVALHWPVTAGGPGQLFVRGQGAVQSAIEAKSAIWGNGGWKYDLGQFFGSYENPDLVFIEIEPSYASLVGPDFVRQTWRPGG